MAVAVTDYEYRCHPIDGKKLHDNEWFLYRRAFMIAHSYHFFH